MLLLSLASCGSHSERSKAREEVLAWKPIDATEAESNAVLWIDRASETQQDDLESPDAGLLADQSEQGRVLTLNGGVLFDTDETSLEPGPRVTLDRLAAFMQRYPERNLMIEGHTDSTGDDPYNLVLSLHRANAVRKSLVARGIEETRMHTIALGENFPVAANDSKAGRQLNRRVEIVLSEEDGLFSAAAQRIAATQ
jgi:outer membrane protein OmpA-like peptidoglycan-associated protein